MRLLLCHITYLNEDGTYKKNNNILVTEKVEFTIDLIEQAEYIEQFIYGYEFKIGYKLYTVISVYNVTTKKNESIYSWLDRVEKRGRDTWN
ncbi:hypothetical protein BU649_09485 [Staphylococcus chromogenes]|nr:hypothetical protein BU649_09485 [Staphylococcus chromogenes]PTG86116.1 hypothetical protein BU644_04130 [Staphylococcus chromogenes]PTH03382.1 hypothetical protein BU635_02335 [Staphylococcus chromogenes]RIM01364.1 hypothetical protein BU683_11430 [Staphylococcus chromogenes]RIM18835.1 hypothetical protein BU660_11590 [Staphylococcus chromogenes]